MAVVVFVIALLLLLLLVLRQPFDNAGSATGPCDDQQPAPGPVLPGRGDLKSMLLPFKYVLESEKTANGSNPATPAGLKFRLWAIGLPYVAGSEGYDPAAVAAICLHETGYALSFAAREYSNLFGVSYYDKTLKKWRPYKYQDCAACWLHFVKVLSATRYRVAQQIRGDGPVWLGALNDAGYNSTPEWRAGVLAAYQAMKRVL